MWIQSANGEWINTAMMESVSVQPGDAGGYDVVFESCVNAIVYSTCPTEREAVDACEEIVQHIQGIL